MWKWAASSSFWFTKRTERKAHIYMHKGIFPRQRIVSFIYVCFQDKHLFPLAAGSSWLGKGTLTSLEEKSETCLFLCAEPSWGETVSCISEDFYTFGKTGTYQAQPSPQGNSWKDWAISITPWEAHGFYKLPQKLSRSSWCSAPLRLKLRIKPIKKTNCRKYIFFHCYVTTRKENNVSCIQNIFLVPSGLPI